MFGFFERMKEAHAEGRAEHARRMEAHRNYRAALNEIKRNKDISFREKLRRKTEVLEAYRAAVGREDKDCGVQINSLSGYPMSPGALVDDGGNPT